MLLFESVVLQKGFILYAIIQNEPTKRSEWQV